MSYVLDELWPGPATAARPQALDLSEGWTI